MAGLAPTIDLYIGAPIEHDSERRTLEHLVELLNDRKTAAVVLANINARSRQIDLVLVTERQVLVIEAKGYSNAVCGNANGPWEVRTASGWRKFPNPYVQTRDAALALRDEMQAFTGTGAIPYPSAALTFVPMIPLDSSAFTGDFKVTVCGLGELSNHVTIKNNNPWPLNQWHRFAEHLRLERATSITEIFSPALASASRLVTKYRDAFKRTYGPAAAELLSLSCQIEGDASSSENVLLRATDDHVPILLRGPSGCGKSMLAAKIGISTLSSGIPLMLPAKDFSGQLRPVLDREAGLLDVPSTLALLRAARLLDLPIMLLIDGYNECPESHRTALTRSISAFVRRYIATPVLTSRTPLERGDLLTLTEVAIPEPDRVLKASIAAAGSAEPIPPELDALLDSVSSGLEARLVGELGRTAKPSVSRYGLFDAYARSRLGTNATAGIRTLARIAGLMIDRLTFSLSIRDVDRLTDTEKLPATILQILEHSNLLLKRGDRVSFRHELFFNAFSAEAVVRDASRLTSVNSQSDSILEALALPRYAESNAMIVGAIDDEALIERVLLGVTDPMLLLACRAGEAGAFAKRWINHRMLTTVSRLREEARQVDFSITTAGWDGVGADPATLFSWSAPDLATIFATAMALWEGDRLDAILESVALVDQRISQAFTRLKGDPRLRKGASLRSALFANAFVFSSTDSAAITRITAAPHSGLALSAFRNRVPAPDNFYEWLKRDDLTAGQLYVLVSLCQKMQVPDEASGERLPKWLEHWEKYPYHLRLELLHLAVCGGRMDEPHRTALINSLNDLMPRLDPIFAGSALEALERLGALENEQSAHIDDVRLQLRTLLASVEDDDGCTQAWYLYGCRFDHPLSGAYWEAFEELSKADRTRLVIMASKGCTDVSMFVSLLLIEIADSGDPAAGTSISRWTELPALDTPLQQDAVETFVVAHALLGRLNHPLSTEKLNVESVAHREMTACGALFYWTCRQAEDPAATKSGVCRDLWTVLTNPESRCAANVLYLCENYRSGLRDFGGSMPLPSLVGAFPSESAVVCRQALHNLERQSGYFPHFAHHKSDVLRFSVDVLGQSGNLGDLLLLRSLSNRSDVGRNAISAIRRLEQGA